MFNNVPIKMHSIYTTLDGLIIKKKCKAKLKKDCDKNKMCIKIIHPFHIIIAKPNQLTSKPMKRLKFIMIQEMTLRIIIE
jgi:hypothetical protein